MYLAQCSECGRYFDKRYNQISGKRTVTVCKHNNKKYSNEDVFCLNCGSVIARGELSLSEYSKHKFCSSSCAASYNNKRGKRKKHNTCLNCNKSIPTRNKYCSPSCQHEHFYKQYIRKWKSGEYSGTTGKSWIDISDHVKRYIFEKYDYKCAICGWNEINPFTGRLPLEIEHIDGDATNNKEDNLTLLCPNCHSLTKTYRGANKGHGTRNIKWISRSGTTNVDK